MNTKLQGSAIRPNEITALRAIVLQAQGVLEMYEKGNADRKELIKFTHLSSALSLQILGQETEQQKKNLLERDTRKIL